jgi:hypothetical protein
MNFFHQQESYVESPRLSKNIMATSPFVFALLVFKTSYSSKGAYCFGYNYRNRPAMGDIFSIEKALFGCLWTNHPEISSRGDWANENPNTRI